MDLIPGTTLKTEKASARASRSAIDALLNGTGGLTLAQVREITGLEASTIQNWVKRGFVKNPEGKRYGEEQLMRIILINMMHGSLKLEQIAFLMSYINGSVDDRSDDILPDKELYVLLCGIIYDCGYNLGSVEENKTAINSRLGEMNLTAENRQKLMSALEVILPAVSATVLINKAQEALKGL